MGKVIVQGLLVLGVIAAIGWAVLFGPHYIEWFKMDDVVKTSALTWTAFDQNRAQISVRDEIRMREINDVVFEDCTFSENTDLKTVSCNWKVDVNIPLLDQ